MLAHYYGERVTQDEIAGAIYLPEIRGTLTTELADYARRSNLWVRQYTGSETDLRQKLAAGVPLIVLGKFGNQYHYFVVLDVDDFRQTVTVHSDTRAGIEFSQDEFIRFWERADRWTLLVCPPDLASNPSRRATWTLSADEHNDLGVFLERTGQLAAAAGNYREAAELKPANSWFQMNLGNALLKQGLFAEAASAYAQAVKLDPENADAMNNLANAYAEISANLDQAVQLCRRAVELSPSHRAYYLDTLGSVLLKQGKPGEAVAAFESALAATTERQSALRAGIQKRLAIARAAAGKNNE
jgi:tetratricopeptide (TPR) repeat protein